MEGSEIEIKEEVISDDESTISENIIFEDNLDDKTSLQISGIHCDNFEGDKFDKKHICLVCNKHYKNKSNLQRHSLLHTGEKPYHCDVCTKSFSEKSYLKIHLLIHAGQKPHLCEICNKGFSHKTNLRKHIRIHTGEKPYTCHSCNKGFTNKNSLTVHCLSHQGAFDENSEFAQKCLVK